MKFALLIYQTEDSFDRRDDAAALAAGRAYGEALMSAGVFIAGAGLDTPKSGTTLKIRAGKKVLHDGPYAETKEFLAGFGIIDVPDIATALDWAERHPAAGHARIEVRRLLGSHFAVAAPKGA